MSFDPELSVPYTSRDWMCVCEWCDEQIDQVDVSVEAFEVMDGACCKSCFEDWGPK